MFEAGRLAREAGYLKPAKKLLVDLAVTKTGLNHALAFANELFLTLEARGHRVVFSPSSERMYREAIDEREKPGKTPNYNNLWSPMRCTIVYIGTVAIGLTIIEMSEEAEAYYVKGEYVRLTDETSGGGRRAIPRHSWTSRKDFPTGRLCLQAYSPYPRANWIEQWRETKNQSLAKKVPSIVRKLEAAAIEVARLFEEGEREAELERQQWAAQQAKWRREEEERRKQKAIADSENELLRIIEAWAKAKRISEFFADAELRASSLPKFQRSQILNRLSDARELVGTIDALERFRSWQTPEERLLE